MDGYSVQEAASVLGVAEGRVWELLARGVLLGTPEGDSMRVFLKSQAGPIATATARDEPPRTNGNGGTHGSNPEASAFRELLTEFRNLTERYGQALLALGEARGEVAGLRSRVDLLEARLDLRLPEPVDAETVAWEPRPASSAPTEPVAAPTAPRPREPFPRVKPNRRVRRKPQTRSTRDAVSGFAAALERAQDPNPATLGEGEGDVELQAVLAPEVEPMPDQTADAVVVPAIEPLEETFEAASAETAADIAPGGTVEAESVPEVNAEEVVIESALDVAAEEAPAEDVAGEAASAEDVLVEPEPPTYSAVVVEPDWFADGDFAWLDAADVESRGEDSPAPETDVEVVAEAEPVAIAEPRAETQDEPEGFQDEAAEPSSEPIRATEPEPEPEPERAAEPQDLQQAAPALDGEPSADDEPDPAAQVQAAFEPAVNLEPEATFQPPVDFEPGVDFEPEADFAAWQPPEPVAFEVAPDSAPAPEADIEPGAEPPRMSTAVAVEDLEEEEVMWLGGEPETAAVARDDPAPPQRAEVDPWPAVDSVRPPLAMTEDELARLALDEGWDDAEVAAIRAMISPPQQASVDLPGAAELHEAMAALEAVPVRSDPTFDASRQWAKPASASDEQPTYDDWGFESVPTPPPAPPQNPVPRRDVTSLLRPQSRDPGWLDRRRGPAIGAYRRLRRLFPR